MEVSFDLWCKYCGKFGPGESVGGTKEGHHVLIRDKYMCSSCATAATKTTTHTPSGQSHAPKHPLPKDKPDVENYEPFLIKNPDGSVLYGFSRNTDHLMVAGTCYICKQDLKNHDIVWFVAVQTSIFGKHTDFLFCHDCGQQKQSIGWKALRVWTDAKLPVPVCHNCKTVIKDYHAWKVDHAVKRVTFGWTAHEFAWKQDETPKLIGPHIWKGCLSRAWCDKCVSTCMVCHDYVVKDEPHKCEQSGDTNQVKIRETEEFMLNEEQDTRTFIVY